MRFVGLRDAQAGLSRLVNEAQKQRIVLTRQGQPVAMLAGLQGRDLEDVILGQDPEFRTLIEERRRYRGKLISHEALKAQAERELAPGRGRARARATAQRRAPAAKR